MNKGIKIVLVLSLISSGMALALAGVNSFTGPKIEEEKKLREAKAKEEVFENCDFDELNIDNNFDTSQYFYLKSGDKAISKDNNELVGYVYKAQGKNAYGEISLMVGIDSSFKFKTFSVTTNSESYAATLEENYINPVIKNPENYTNTSCGATKGATLIKNMIDEAIQVSKEVR